jgi:hypothetical protein
LKLKEVSMGSIARRIAPPAAARGCDGPAPKALPVSELILPPISVWYTILQTVDCCNPGLCETTAEYCF